MNKFIKLQKINSKETILEVFNELNTISDVTMWKEDLEMLLAKKGKTQAAFFSLTQPIKESLQSQEFSELLNDLEMEKATGIGIGILGNHSLKLRETGEIMDTICSRSQADASIFFGSSSKGDSENAIILFVLTTGVRIT